MEIMELIVFGDMDQKILITITFAAGALLVLVIVTVAIVVLRRKFLRPSKKGPTSPFALNELQKMHETGQISEQEYKKLRNMIIQDL